VDPRGRFDPGKEERDERRKASRSLSSSFRGIDRTEQLQPHSKPSVSPCLRGYSFSRSRFFSDRYVPSFHPFRYSLRMRRSASGALGALSFAGSHSSFFPMR